MSHKTWRRAVLARDNHTCQYCGSQKNLTAHHVIPKAVDRSRSADVDNGITLCLSCHRRVHRVLNERQKQRFICTICHANQWMLCGACLKRYLKEKLYG